MPAASRPGACFRVEFDDATFAEDLEHTSSDAERTLAQREGHGPRSDSLPPHCRFRGTSGRPSTGHARARDPSALAELHQRELLENWSLARVGETLHEIEPLQ